ncbi:ribbon-helix-helix domain-containing protein [Brasilonema bromeliae]|uniref:CopG-like ribbon-helix-helix domain-containing protein n=1 Tax=Brasilonema bromeliae SPC951 TaxID=385972 RepID=A0ABX1P5V4_9CYAN|nr:hypothetical protein [Brasilonema bromeliae]NMG19750.1 hypothetical protein [Brasilonema bromeliae SPC951]
MRILRRTIGCESDDGDSDVSKRFTVTLPDSVFEDLEVLADAQGRPTANLAAFLIEIGIKETKERGEFPEKPEKPKTSKAKKAKEEG